MKNTVVIIFLFLLMQVVSAQPGIEGMIQAEKNFAAWSVANSTKEAFQQFIDSNSIMFDTGRAVKAIDFWNKREKRPGVLNWWPQYAEISATDSFGYTTGPWTFQPSLQDSVVARGRYITVWHLSKNGEWKFLVDIGVDDTPADTIQSITRIDKSKESEQLKFIPHISPIAAAENNFIKLVAKNKEKAYRTYCSGYAILNRHGIAVANDKDIQQQIINSTPADITYQMVSLGASPVSDMAYTFGNVITGGKKENYLHIWRKEKEGWKIAVEVLRY